MPVPLRLVSSGEVAPCVYRPSARSRPAALACSVVVVATVAVALTMINVAVPRPEARPLTVISLELLPQRPPAAAAPAPAMPEQPETPVSAVTAPTPVVALPDQPAPAMATVAAAPAVAPVQPGPPTSSGPTAAPVPAPPASGPMDGGELSGTMLAAPPPTYPMEARRHHEQGTVKLAVLVGLDGRVENVEIASSSGSYRLDRAALGAVRRWRWSPRIRNGEAVMVRGYVTIPFVLRS